ncbi:hypothetical protein TRFO_30328 [Tritrichomonas foetus]|uniref:Uncharacterized protein n=1 Tax=Tritrichomonas foetus TaxID=1144522 RepID=A0A1J4JZ18_9EUKA|nr:hypothetical protein TRFO_30328 [Tritrichomonas foetus]|eukprot:OHT02501.1 hypothetical protein TRFO_30328 [Tritrichomonas foetus]
MKKYLIFGSPFEVISKINNILESQDDHISVTAKYKDSIIKGTIFEKNFLSKIAASTLYNGTQIEFEADSAKNLHLFTKRSMMNNKFHISTFFSTLNYIPQVSRYLYMPKSFATVAAHFNDQARNINAIFEVGLRKSKTPVAIVVISKGLYNLSFRTIVTDRTNVVNATVLAAGAFASIKCDISLSQLQGIELGYLYNSNNLSCFASYDTNRSIVNAGGYLTYNDKNIAFKGKYAIKSKEYFSEICGSVNDGALLSGKINSKGQIEFLTKISPKPWVDVSIKTTSSATGKAKPVTFGWTLDFHKNF